MILTNRNLITDKLTRSFVSFTRLCINWQINLAKFQLAFDHQQIYHFFNNCLPVSSLSLFFFLFPIDIFFWNLTDWTLAQSQLNTLFYRMSCATPHAQSHKKKPWWKLIYIRLDRLTWAGSEKAFGPCTHRALRERGLKLWTSADRNQMWEWVGLLKDYF